MKKYFLATALGLLISNFCWMTAVWADDESTLDQIDKEGETDSTRTKWDAQLKEKYALTDEKLAELRAQGLHGPQIAIVSQLAKTSGKPIEEVVKMRTEQKMGWGMIAKELGVPPKEIGQSVAGLHRNVRSVDRHTRREERAARREARKEKHSGKGHGAGGKPGQR